MFQRVFLLLGFAFVAATASDAQLVASGVAIPNDLLITLRTQGSWSGGSSELTIDATGLVNSSTSVGLPVSPSLLFKPQKLLKPYVPPEKLKTLIAEFDKIDFFRIAETFPGKDEQRGYFITDMGSQTISIRMNGRTTQVADYVGYTSQRSKNLVQLAARIRGAGIWNYEGGKIPKNFELRYRTTIGGNIILNEIKIDADGKVSQSFFSSDKRYGGPTHIKTITVGRLSNNQIRGLLDALEAANFSIFVYSTLTKNDGCTSEPHLGAERRSHINVQINHVQQMYASLYDPCLPEPQTLASFFEQASNAVRDLMASVRVKP